VFEFVVVIVVIVSMMAITSKKSHNKQKERQDHPQDKEIRMGLPVNANPIPKRYHTPSYEPYQVIPTISLMIKGHYVGFYADTHTYVVDGKKVPSVTGLLDAYARVVGWDDYAGIRPEVLRSAALRGTRLHEIIEEYERTGTNPGYPIELENYIRLKSEHDFKVKKMEQVLLLFDEKKKPICAGRLDLVLDYQGNRCICDIKRTSRLYPEKVKAQLNLYRIGYMQSYEEDISELYCLRLRDNLAQFKQFEIDMEIAKRIVKGVDISVIRKEKCRGIE